MTMWWLLLLLFSQDATTTTTGLGGFPLCRRGEDWWLGE